jgi:hypothetical protein
MYQVTFSDGNIRDFAANTIAEAIYSSHTVDENKYVMIKEIIDHEKATDAISKGNEWYIS